MCSTRVVQLDARSSPMRSEGTPRSVVILFSPEDMHAGMWTVALGNGADEGCLPFDVMNRNIEVKLWAMSMAMTSRPGMFP